MSGLVFLGLNQYKAVDKVCVLLKDTTQHIDSTGSESWTSSTFDTKIDGQPIC